MISPAHSGNWLLGVGPTFIFPTAGSVWTGQGHYQMEYFSDKEARWGGGGGGA